MDYVAAFAHNWHWRKDDVLALSMDELNGYMERMNEWLRKSSR